MNNNPYLNNFTCFQDVDGDGLNELLVTSSWGYVYCFDTPSPTPATKVRSELQFYSEYRLGVAEYVAPPIPTAPVIAEEKPLDLSVNQAVNPTLSVRVTSFQGLSMDIDFATSSSESGPWVTISSQSGPSGTYSVPTSLNVAGRRYFWRVSASEQVSGHSRTKVFSFTTVSGVPTQGSPILQSAGGDLTARNQTTDDPNGDGVTNIYNWQVGGVSVTGLNLPFETRTSSSLLSTDVLFTDSFNNFNDWNTNGVPGVTNWDINTAQSYSAPSSAHATSTSTYLISNNIDTSGAQTVTVGFWYRVHGLTKDNNVYLQFWNGTSFTPSILTGAAGRITPVPIVRSNIFNFGNSSRGSADTWQFYSVEFNERVYMRSDFKDQDRRQRDNHWPGPMGRRLDSHDLYPDQGLLGAWQRRDGERRHLDQQRIGRRRLRLRR